MANGPFKLLIDENWINLNIYNVKCHRAGSLDLSLWLVSQSSRALWLVIRPLPVMPLLGVVGPHQHQHHHRQAQESHWHAPSCSRHFRNTSQAENQNTLMMINGGQPRGDVIFPLIYFVTCKKVRFCKKGEFSGIKYFTFPYHLFWMVDTISKYTKKWT